MRHGGNGVKLPAGEEVLQLGLCVGGGGRGRGVRSRPGRGVVSYTSVHTYLALHHQARAGPLGEAGSTRRTKGQEVQVARPRSAVRALADGGGDVGIHVRLAEKLEGLDLLQLLQQTLVPTASNLRQPGFPQLIAAHESGAGAWAWHEVGE